MELEDAPEELGIDDTLVLDRVLSVMPEEDKLLLVAAYVYRIHLDVLAQHYRVSRRTIDKRIAGALERTRKALGIERKKRSRVSDLPVGVFYIRHRGKLYVHAKHRGKYLGSRPATPEGIAELIEIHRKAKDAA